MGHHLADDKPKLLLEQKHWVDREKKYKKNHPLIDTKTLSNNRYLKKMLGEFLNFRVHSFFEWCANFEQFEEAVEHEYFENIENPTQTKYKQLREFFESVKNTPYPWWGFQESFKSDVNEVPKEISEEIIDILKSFFFKFFKFESKRCIKQFFSLIKMKNNTK